MKRLIVFFVATLFFLSLSSSTTWASIPRMWVEGRKSGEPSAAGLSLEQFLAVEKLNSIFGELEKDEKEFPSDPFIKNNLGIIYLFMGDIEKTIHYLQEAVRIDPSYFNGHLNLAIVYFLIGDDSNSLRELEISINLDQGNFVPYLFKGFIYLEKGDFNDAVSLLKESVNYVNPSQQSYIYMTLGEIYYCVYQFDEAIEYFNAVLNMDPECPQCPIIALISMSEIYKVKNEYRIAEEQLLQALELDENNTETILNLGILYDVYMRDYVKAKRVYLKFLDLAPNADNAEKIRARIEKFHED